MTVHIAFKLASSMIFLGYASSLIAVNETPPSSAPPKDMSQHNEIVIFDGHHQRRPTNLSCKPCQDANHGARVVDGIVQWKWDGKFSCWCGWMFEDFEPRNFDQDIQDNYILEIKYSGVYSGGPSPQVKFFDSNGGNTSLKDFSAFSKTSADGKAKIVRIPIRAFSMSSSVDPSQIMKLQFDAGWDSDAGDIAITSIKLVRNQPSAE